ncbi:unnamed protein product [Lepeophtheirus salmonis]|uniref:(salmon louse) hypothetical protein n=1 Tax=Lepeophtheirus salmonis TaxID=72036 RepID=A0A7R8CP20_LEPSM|nr:unnamed protein product [Lepeophtheirus salmonis]CAF2882214.1 unnamed protein product [Lepeophtheirus salmonis]
MSGSRIKHQATKRSRQKKAIWLVWLTFENQNGDPILTQTQPFLTIVSGRTWKGRLNRSHTIPYINVLKSDMDLEWETMSEEFFLKVGSDFRYELCVEDSGSHFEKSKM